MEFIADVLLVAGALGAGLYCFILSRRLTHFTDLENGVGAAVAVLSAQVTDLQAALLSAQKTASHSTDTLETLTKRAENSAKRLELMVAALHDLPPQDDPPTAPPPTSPVFSRHGGQAR
jgi:hypothetical protein